MIDDVYRSQRIVLRLGDNRTLHKIRSFDSDLRRVTLSGAVIAPNDGASKTLVYNWKTDEHAYLDDVGDTQHGHCFQVGFTLTTILVVARPRSITLYTAPPFPTHIATHWVDGIRATPTSILIRESLVVRAKFTRTVLPLLLSSNSCFQH
ncbi:hypothetical protein EDD85DRAFT_1008574, partial [Armillaria nabsnona]